MAIKIADLTDPAAVRAAISECDALGTDDFLALHGYGRAVSYFLDYEGRRYDSKAIAGVAYQIQHPDQSVTSDDFSGGEQTVAKALRELGFVVTGPEDEAPASTAATELELRNSMCASILAEPDPASLSPARIRELQIYGGAQGIWVDAARTRHVQDAPQGITVSVLRTGKSYADDLSADGVIYHYPTTERPPARDAGEVEATKTAGRLHLPIFVITPGKKSTTRAVTKGWVEDWDDDARIFLIAFRDDPPPTTPNAQELDDENDAFSLKDATPPATPTATLQSRRPHQVRFKFQVLKRYGPRCAVCNIEELELIDAAHLCAKSDRGSDDPRNGLPLCATHHRALDAHLYGIDPKTTELVARPSGPTLAALQITAESLKHLDRQPHPEALEHLWRAFGPI